MLKLAKQLSEVGFQFCLNDELKYAIKKTQKTKTPTTKNPTPNQKSNNLSEN